MKSSIDFLNRALESYSGYRIQQMLGISSGAVGTWKRRGHVSPYYAAKLAELTGDDPKEAIAIAGAEAEPDQEKRSYLLKKLVGAAASAAFVSVNLFLTPTPAEAAPALKTADQNTLYYVKYTTDITGNTGSR
jgi:hypothetical protein